MKIQDIIKLGDKVDLQLAALVEQQRKGVDVVVNTFQSSVLDFISDQEIELAMPMNGGKIVLFQVGVRLEMLVYTNRGMYNSLVLVKNRYKKDNIYMISVELLNELSKFQRRAFFRVEHTCELRFFPIPIEVAEVATTKELYDRILTPEYRAIEQMGEMRDISGGGIKFVSHIRLEPDSYVAIVMRLTNDKVDETFYLVAQIISCEDFPGDNTRHINRARFGFKDLVDRESIVRFVFEEERCIRRKVGR